ncbi:unnamed protein product [Acanthoscelides obtectus]|uniref:Uncharacterized protein n=1 Tax=Acanthoscelides obtectus TaxID=200917 RepID=A0A9P0NXH1_ACAOB|nr:unnamed protein product [Acanthoscelides obtectus]CAK1661874.1 hypothetical protein AOBTE_LOCUS22850 [Acanthoscelides obtectus]
MDSLSRIDIDKLESSETDMSDIEDIPKERMPSLNTHQVAFRNRGTKIEMMSSEPADRKQ